MKINWQKLLPIILVLAFSLLSSYRLFRPGYFSMQDDMQIFRLQQLDKCVHDLQIPCRYVPDAGFGYGYPLYNYYSPLPFYLAELFHLLGFSLINSIKIMFVLSRVVAGLGMYLFVYLFLGNFAAMISSSFFVYAPYMAVDSFVRGSLAELLALSLVPLVFWSFYKYIVIRKTNPKMILPPTIFLISLILSHNLTAFVVLPVLSAFILLILILNKRLSFTSFVSSFIPLIFSLLISSFFLIPAVLEKKFVTLDTMTQGYFYYAIHFVGLFQLLFSRFWGYGASLWGPVDGMSFQIGYLQWIVPILTIILLILNLRRSNTKLIFYSIFFLSLALFCLFLVHSRSTFIWKTLPFMPFFQFPWRFIGPAIFALSVLSGFIVLPFKNNKYLSVITFILISSVILINLPYFKEDIWFPNLTDNGKLGGEELIKQSGAGLKDYWPNSGKTVPVVYAPQQPTSDNKSQIQIDSYSKKSNKIEAKIKVISNKADIIFPLVYFPDWTVTVNGQTTGYEITKDLGLVKINLPKGDYNIKINFIDTKVRKIANTISLISIAGLVVFLLVSKRIHDENS